MHQAFATEQRSPIEFTRIKLIRLCGIETPKMHNALQEIQFILRKLRQKFPIMLRIRRINEELILTNFFVFTIPPHQHSPTPIGFNPRSDCGSDTIAIGENKPRADRFANWLLLDSRGSFRIGQFGSVLGNDHNVGCRRLIFLGQIRCRLLR